MATPSKKLSRGITNGYLSARGLAAGLAMVFALVYSTNLGVERRSLVAFIMATTMVVSVILTSGVSLAFRRSVPTAENKLTLNSYLYLTTFLSILASGLTLIFVLIYSKTKTEIPKTLLLITVIYAFFACLDFCYHQALIAFNLFKLAAILDVLTISIQILIYSMLFLVNQVSIAVSLFTALIISYITSTTAALLLLISIKDSSIKLDFQAIRFLINSSKNYHLFGIANGFADRIDRIIIAWFLPLGILGKYAVGTSLISFLRFLPEAASRLIVGGNSIPTFGAINRTFLRRLFAVSGLALIGSALSQIFVNLFFGDAWKLPSLVLLLFAAQEIARGYYQIVISKLISDGSERQVRNLSLALIFSSFILPIIGSKIMGIYGVPLGIGISYVVLNVYLKATLLRPTKK
ncbi:MAG TPA: oligosaccharide flippase family protein [Candidatus Paceibacterota bacterium]|nr:oligosaccharide flippase family protein [Candidatus Paceibacterota bacterium]